MGTNKGRIAPVPTPPWFDSILTVPMLTSSSWVTFVAPVTLKVWAPKPHPPVVAAATPLAEELLPGTPGTVPEPPSAQAGVAQLAPKMLTAAMATTVTDMRTRRALREKYCDFK
jgi:hypothetical protein